MTGDEAGAIHLREARIDELPALGELCLRSKAVWGYDAAFLEACRQELSLTPGDLQATTLRVAARDGRPIAVGQIAVAGQDAELVTLRRAGCAWPGMRRALFDWAVAAARAAGARRMTIDSDPGAVPFYVRMGAGQAGLVPSGSIPGRLVPRLEIALDVATNPCSDISRPEAVPEGAGQ